jgi:hypothetical protein
MYFTAVIILCGLYLCACAHDNQTEDQNLSVDDTINKLLDHATYDLQDAGIAMLLKEPKGNALIYLKRFLYSQNDFVM